MPLPWLGEQLYGAFGVCISKRQTLGLQQLPTVDVYSTSVVSVATDSSDPQGATAFTSNTQDRINTHSVPVIEPAHIVALPKGQAFALIEGG